MVTAYKRPINFQRTRSSSKSRDAERSAWLAMGFFPGLVRPVNLNDEILSKLRYLGRVYDFKDYAPKPR